MSYESQWTLPGRVIDLLWQDPSFFEEISKLKRASFRIYPRYDQWFDDAGLHMEFALAGFSPEDLLIKIEDNSIIVESQGIESPAEPDDAVRGIARRKFRTKFQINPNLSPENTTASMEHGMLKIIVPKRIDAIDQKIIEINR